MPARPRLESRKARTSDPERTIFGENPVEIYSLSDWYKTHRSGQVFLIGEPVGASYSGLASELGMSEGALKVAVRRKFREVLRAEIADTVASPKEVKEEMQYLLSVLSG